MAAKRFAGVKVNWKSILDRFPKESEDQMAKLSKLRKNHETYVRRVAALPEKVPTIDWASYKTKIPNAAFVDSIKQKYEAVQIPYPKDNVAADIDAREKELAQEHANLKETAKAEIQKLEAELGSLDGLLPVDAMTLQEFKQAYPEHGPSVTHPSPDQEYETAKEWRVYIAAKEKGLPAERPRG